MPTPLIIILVVCAIALIAFLIYYFLPKTIILRRLKKLPYSKIGSLQSHKYSKIEGVTLNVRTPLIAPLSKRKCVYYKIMIQKKVSSGKSSHWDTIVDEEIIQDFFVEQTGERLLIFPKKKPKNYYDYLVTDKTANSGSFNDPTPEFKTLLDRYNIETEGFFGFNKQLRYHESIIEVGERITVAGFVKWVELENPIADYNYSRVASLIAKDKIKILITDSPDALRPRRQR
ncbi:hypothetical protein [Lacinutrix sp. Bg11-31]|uniref:hypothetical protein n=1 Tax=Lacinutrix sp. Bg11-31 TaxID=2057808 RepID=UPI000C302741|nr:hypothetical protein [Lacinutrix sp. Bg11-31]AUC82796.1 hypothetical protein CW733_11955 [Lacinutrix sp. Bg11-31]